MDKRRRKKYFVPDLTLEDIAEYFKGLPLEYGDQLARSYINEINQRVPNTLQNFCLASILMLDNDRFQLTLSVLPFGYSEKVTQLLENICRRCVAHAEGCWACFGQKSENCEVCDRTQNVCVIQSKQQKKTRRSLVRSQQTLSGNDSVYSSFQPYSNETSAFPSVSTENYFKLIMTNLVHLVENKSVQKLLGDLIYGRFNHVSVHYVCVQVGDWRRFREKTVDKAFIVLYGPDSKQAGTYLINLFKNPILGDIHVLPARNQRLYPEEKTGGFVYRDAK